jgi:hypothetical protein
MKRLVALTAALTLAACSDAPEILAPGTPPVQLAASSTTSTYPQPFSSVLLNACTGEEVTISGTQVFTVTDRRAGSGRAFFTMEGVIDGVATTADGSTSAFSQTARTTSRQATPDAPVYGKSNYRFTVAGANGSDDFIVRVRSGFVFDPLTGVFTTTSSSVKSSCR